MKSIQSVLQKKRMGILLIIGISLAVFSPVLNSGVIEMDDAAMISKLNNPIKEYSLKNKIWPKRAGRYYRPMLNLSFVMDQKIWQFEYSGYHLTNNLLHTVNTLILYLIALFVFKQHSWGKELAFFTAVIFCLHPLTVESVAWISGRTDILSTFFCLLAFFFFLQDKPIVYLLVPFLVLGGLLSKENAVSVIPIIIIIAFIRVWIENKDWKKSVWIGLKWSLILTIPLIIYVYLRFAGMEHTAAQVKKITVSKGNFLQEKSFFSDLWLLPAMIGFYLKKLLIPFPLNFAIAKIHSIAYSVVFVSILLSVGWSIKKQKYFFSIGIILTIIAFAPSLAIALSDIAWTKYAERYLYLAIPVFSLFVCYGISLNSDNWSRENVLKYGIVILILMVCITSNRVGDWKDRYTLWEDTVEKNPNHGMVLYQYGTILGPESGKKYFERAIKVGRDDEWKDLSYLALAKIKAQKNDPDTALLYIEKALTINKNRKNLYRAAGIVSRLLRNADVDNEKLQLNLISIYKQAYDLRARPFDLYNLINIYRNAKDQKQMEKYFLILQDKFPKSRAARALAKKYPDWLKS